MDPHVPVRMILSLLMITLFTLNAACSKSKGSDPVIGPVLVPPSAFDLSSPASGSSDILPDATLSWANATGETGYVVEISAESGFTAPLLYSSATLTADTINLAIPPGTLSAGTTYYWRVKASNSDGTTTASNAPFSFTTIASGRNVWTQTEDVSAGNDYANSIAIDSDFMYIAGMDTSPGGVNTQWRIEKRSLFDGTRVPVFGTGGVVASNPSANPDEPLRIVIDKTYMYVAGFDETVSGTDSQWRLEKRRLSDGTLVSEFGSGGIVTSNSSTRFEMIMALVADSSAIYLAGTDRSPGPTDTQWRIEKRDFTTGALVTEFGSGGIITENTSTWNDVPQDIAIDADSLYIIGLDFSANGTDCQWRIEKRSKNTGAFVNTFGTNGIVTNNPSPSYDRSARITIDGTYMYVAGQYFTPGPGYARSRIEKRSLIDGSLVADFGTYGFVSSGTGSGYISPTSIANDANYLYIGMNIAVGTSTTDYEWRMEKRNKADGALVASFATNGVYSDNYGVMDDSIASLAINDSYIFAAGYIDYDETFIAYPSKWRIEKIVK